MELSTEKQAQLLAQKVKQQIQREKDRALIPAMTALANEFEERAKNGSLAKELKTMKAGALLGQLTRIAAAIKESAPSVIMVSSNSQPAEETFLNAHSIINVTPEERIKRRKSIEAQIEKGE